MTLRLSLAAALSLALPALLPTPALAQASSADTIRMDHVSVQVVGKGSPVILIPGLGSPRAAWDGVVPALSRTHSVYLVQVNGFGGDAPGANLKPGVLDGVVADLAMLIQQRKLKAPALVGHSMGGLIGLMLAARHPDSLGKLMVVDALPFFAVTMTPPGAELSVAMVEPQAAGMRDAVASGYGKPADPAAAERNVAGLTLKPANVPVMKGWAMAADPRVMAECLYEDLTTDWRPELPKIRVPVTVIYAWNQRFPNKVQAEPYYRRQFAGLAQLNLTEVGESGHFVMLDQPESFAQALASFVG
jgi:pimeloyl-ACP methyl ester carboxylesterase